MSDELWARIEPLLLVMVPTVVHPVGDPRRYPQGHSWRCTRSPFRRLVTWDFTSNSEGRSAIGLEDRPGRPVGLAARSDTHLDGPASQVSSVVMAGRVGTYRTSFESSVVEASATVCAGGG